MKEKKKAKPKIGGPWRKRPLNRRDALLGTWSGDPEILEMAWQASDGFNYSKNEADTLTRRIGRSAVDRDNERLCEMFRSDIMEGTAKLAELAEAIQAIHEVKAGGRDRPEYVAAYDLRQKIEHEILMDTKGLEIFSQEKYRRQEAERQGLTVEDFDWDDILNQWRTDRRPTTQEFTDHLKEADGKTRDAKDVRRIAKICGVPLSDWTPGNTRRGRPKKREVE